MTLDYGSQVSRTLQAQDRSYETVVWNQGKPPLDSELNLMSEIQNQHYRRDNLGYQSGVLDFRLAGFDDLYKGTVDLTFPSAFLGANEFVLQNFRAVVDGWIVDVIDSSVEGGNYTGDGWISIEMPAVPAAGQRQDLVFLEVFRVLVRPNSTVNKPAIDKIYRYGNTQYRGTNLDDEMLDPAVNIETTQRVQLQYKIRVATDVNFTNFPEGVDDTSKVKARGPNASDTSYTYTNDGANSGDHGLYIAGNGDSTSRSVLGTVDGYVYAIPLLGLHRRNSTAYNVHSNPNGSAISVGSAAKSDRPDRLYYDEINWKDIVDLRHLIMDDENSLSEVINMNFNKLERGENQLSWGNDFTGSVKGVRLMQVDAISATDQSGIFDFGVPDGFRGVWANRSTAQSISVDMTEGTPLSFKGGFFTYTPGTQQVAIDGTVISGLFTPPFQSNPTMIWKSTGNTVGLSVGWVLGPTSGTATINPADPNFVPGGDIAVVVYTYWAVANALSYVPNEDEIYKVFNANTTQNEYMAFNDRLQEKRTVDIHEVPLASFPITGGNQDYIEDYNQLYYTRTYIPDGVLRLYHGFMQGNNTNTYNMPSTLAGSSIAGFYRFYDYTDPNNPLEKEPSSVTRNADGTYTLVFGTIFLTSQIIKYEAALSVKSPLIESYSRSILLLYQTLQITDTSATGSKVDFVVDHPGDGVIQEGMTYRDLSIPGDRTFAYVNGLRVKTSITYGKGTGTVNVHFFNPPPAGATVIMEFLASYEPVADDRIQFFYEFDPYQGIGLDIDEAVIKRIGDGMIVHTLGTGGDAGPVEFMGADFLTFDKNLFGLSLRFPIVNGRSDSDLTTGTFSLMALRPSTFTTGAGENYMHLYGLGRLPNFLGYRVIQATSATDWIVGLEAGEGQKIRTATPIFPAVTPPTRGVSQAWAIETPQGELKYQLISYKNVVLDSDFGTPGANEHVWFMLVQLPPSNELYMIIFSHFVTLNDTSPMYSDFSFGAEDTAYDVYRVKYRPLLSRR